MFKTPLIITCYVRCTIIIIVAGTKFSAVAFKMLKTAVTFFWLKVWANSAEPEGAVWSGSTLYAILLASFRFVTFKYSKTMLVIIEPPHDKTVTEWHVHPAKTQINLGIGSVWSVFAVHSMGSLGPKLSSCRLIRLGWCPGWSESSLGAQSFCWFCHEAAQLLCFVVFSLFRRNEAASHPLLTFQDVPL